MRDRVRAALQIFPEFRDVRRARKPPREADNRDSFRRLTLVSLDRARRLLLAARQMACELPHRRILEESRDFGIRHDACTQLLMHLHHLQRAPAEVKKAVVRADGRDAQHALPYLRNLLL